MANSLHQQQVQSKRITGSVASSAEKMAKQMGATAKPAIQLVGFDEEVRTAVEYVFGSSLIVDGMDAANKICDATKTKTVTLQGDVFDPSGTISGGSNKGMGATLKKLSEFANAKEVMGQCQKELRVVDKEYVGERAGRENEKTRSEATIISSSSLLLVRSACCYRSYS